MAVKMFAPFDAAMQNKYQYPVSKYATTSEIRSRVNCNRGGNNLNNNTNTPTNHAIVEITVNTDTTHALT
jgi:hypothetical protein